MKTQSDFWLWLRETYQRLGQKTPKFFKVMSWINGVMLLASGIPYILTEMDIIVPARWEAIVLKVVAIASGWGLFMNKLTVERPTVAITASGEVISKTHAGELPFTAKKEIEKVTEVSKT